MSTILHTQPTHALDDVQLNLIYNLLKRIKMAATAQTTIPTSVRIELESLDLLELRATKRWLEDRIAEKERYSPKKLTPPLEDKMA
jgi:hypothetical protein